MARSKAKARADREDRKKRRAQKGTLKEQQVKPRTLARYQRAYTLWDSFARCFNTCLRNPQIDEAMAGYLEHLYAEGDPMSYATDALAALQYFRPRTIGKLKQSWKLLSVWRRTEPPNRVKPFTPLMVLGLAGAALHTDAMDMAAILLVGFDCFLRTGELFSLKCAFITLYTNKAVIKLIDTKTSSRKGTSEQVVVTSQLAVNVLRRVCSERSPGQTLLSGSVSAARSLLRKLLSTFDLSTLDYNFYSLRRGGATSYFYRTGSMQQTLATGRWENSSTARIYIQDAAAQAGELNLSSMQRQALTTSANFLKQWL